LRGGNYKSSTLKDTNLTDGEDERKTRETVKPELPSWNRGKTLLFLKRKKKKKKKVGGTNARNGIPQESTMKGGLCTNERT